MMCCWAHTCLCHIQSWGTANLWPWRVVGVHLWGTAVQARLGQALRVCSLSMQQCQAQQMWQRLQLRSALQLVAAIAMGTAVEGVTTMVSGCQPTMQRQQG